VPMHWTNQLAASGRIGAATAAHTDPVSGQPGLKFGAAAVRPFPAAWYGFTGHWLASRTAGDWNSPGSRCRRIGTAWRQRC
jgi:assimilatory nitrate reductase catalytic subunit